MGSAGQNTSVLGTAMRVQRDLNGDPCVAQLGPAGEQEAWHHPCWGPWGWPLTKNDGCCFSIASMSKLLTQTGAPECRKKVPSPAWEHHGEEMGETEPGKGPFPAAKIKALAMAEIRK